MRTLLLMALLAPALVQAQVWAQEPEKVVGVRMGAPLAESGIAECSGVPSNDPCLDRQTVGLSRLLRTGLRATINIFEDDGVVSGIRMDMPHGHFEAFVRTMIERYGSPHTDTLETVQNRAGATFSNRQLMWRGERISIRMRERHRSVDTSVVNFDDNASVARAASRLRERTKSEASKL